MWSIPQETADLVTFTEEILDKKLHILFERKFVMLLNVVFHIETSIASLANSWFSSKTQITGFYRKYNSGMKWGKDITKWYDRTGV